MFGGEDEILKWRIYNQLRFLQGIIYSLLDKKREAAEQFEMYRAVVPDEFPQKEFIDDIVLSATTASREQFEKEFAAEFSYKKWSKEEKDSDY